MRKNIHFILICTSLVMSSSIFKAYFCYLHFLLSQLFPYPHSLFYRVAFFLVIIVFFKIFWIFVCCCTCSKFLCQLIICVSLNRIVHFDIVSPFFLRLLGCSLKSLPITCFPLKKKQS